MPRIYSFIVFIVLLSTSPVNAQEQSLTLSDCYSLALKQSETIAIRQELITEAEGRFEQSLSGILPRVSFSSSDKRQDGNGGSQFTLREVPERKFTFSQPLFSGFKEFAAMAGTKAERRQRIQEKARAEQLLLADVSEAFYLLLEQREDLQILQGMHGILVERVQELKEREQLGRSRVSEVITVQAQLYRTEAEMELVQSREEIARQLLEFLTGYARIERIVDPYTAIPAIEEEEAYLAKAVARPDVLAAGEAKEVAKRQVQIARAKYFPTVGLEGNYYVERVGGSKDVTWDASLKVDVPIFQGGQAAGSVREAASVARQATLRFSETRRKAIQEVKDAYVDFQASVARNEALAKATGVTEESYWFQTQEYRSNLVSNLDVLEALQNLQDARRELIHARYEAKRLYWHMKATAGETLP